MLKIQRINDKGQVSIYLILMFLVLVVFALFSVEMVHMNMGKAKGELACRLCTDSLLARYEPELFDWYHLLYINCGKEGAGGEKGSEYFKNEVNDTLSPMDISTKQVDGIYDFSLSEVNVEGQTKIEANHYADFKKQIADYMLYRGGSMAVSALADYVKNAKVSENEEEENTDLIEKKEITFSEKENPIQLVENLGKADLLLLVKPANLSVSEEDVDIRSSKEEEVFQFSFPADQKEWKQLADSCLDIQMCQSNLISNVAVLGYIKDCFSSAISQEKNKHPHRLKMEMEYLLSGKKNDRANMLNAVKMVLGIRYVSNLAVILSDKEKGEIAEAVATVISVLTFTEEGVEIEKYVVLAAWAYVESIVDVKALLRGEKVPIYKKQSQWKTDLLSLMEYDSLDGGEETGIGYEEYLLLILAMQVERDELYERMIDIMEINAKEVNEMADYGELASSITVETEMKLQKKFFYGIGDESYDLYYFQEAGY